MAHRTPDQAPLTIRQFLRRNLHYEFHDEIAANPSLTPSSGSTSVITPPKKLVEIDVQGEITGPINRILNLDAPTNPGVQIGDLPMPLPARDPLLILSSEADVVLAMETHLINGIIYTLSKLFGQTFQLFNYAEKYTGDNKGRMDRIWTISVGQQNLGLVAIEVKTPGSLQRQNWDDAIVDDPSSGSDGELHGNAYVISQQATKYARANNGPVVVVVFDWNRMAILDFYPRERSPNKPLGETEAIYNNSNAPARIYWTRGVKDGGNDADITTGFGEALLSAIIMALQKRGFLPNNWP